MKRLLSLLFVGLLLFGCTQLGAPLPTATPVPTAIATATPSPTPEPVAAAVVEAAAESIPLGTSLAGLTGAESKAPEQYVITTQSEFKADVALSKLSQLEFDDGDVLKTLRKIATARSTRKTMSWQPTESGINQFTILWEEEQNNAGNWVDSGASVEVVLSKTGESSICTRELNTNPDCITPSKEQVDAIWAALKSNAFEDSLQLIAPGVDLKTLLKVEKITKTTYIGRACDGYVLTLSETALDLLSALSDVNSRTITDIKGDICIDSEYGFPLYMNLLTSIGPVSEHVTRFSTAKVGVLQYPYHYSGLCFVNKPCIEGLYTNPSIQSSDYPEPRQKIDAKTAAACKEPGRITMNVGDCVRFGNGHGFVLKSAGSGRIALTKFDQNFVAYSEYQIRPSGNIKKDQYDLGRDWYDKTLALAVISISEGSADLDFLSFDPEWDTPPGSEYVRKYNRGFLDTANPEAWEAYYAIFSPGTKVEEGLQKYGNADHIYLKNGVTVAFYWYYPEPYSEVSMAGTLDSKVTAYVFESGVPVNGGKAYVLEVGKPVSIGPFQKNYPSTGSLELKSADLTRDGSIQVIATSAATAISTPTPTARATATATPTATATATTAASPTPLPTVKLASCEVPVYFELLATLTSDVSCYNDPTGRGDYVSKHYAPTLQATYTLPAGATNVRYGAIEYTVNDACEKVTVNGVKAVDKSCTLPWRGGNCPMAHSGYGELAPNGVTISGNTVTVVGSYADFYGGKGDNGGMTVRGIMYYQAPTCLDWRTPIVVRE